MQTFLNLSRTRNTHRKHVYSLTHFCVKEPSQKGNVSGTNKIDHYLYAFWGSETDKKQRLSRVEIWYRKREGYVKRSQNFRGLSCPLALADACGGTGLEVAG